MNQRTIEMIQLLSKERKEIVVSGFAEYFQVSQKTIRNDIKEINQILSDNEKEQIVIKSGGRITLPKDFEDNIYLFTIGDYYSYKLSKAERKKIASVMIVNAPDYITLATIAENLFVCRATVINDLKDIKAFIQNGNLTVESHANKGLRVDGLESEKRKFLMSTLSPDLHKEHKNAVIKHVSVQSGDRIIVQKILSEQEDRHKKYLDDASFMEIILYLRIMINRNQMKEFLEPQKDMGSEYYMFAYDIVKNISQYCDVVTTENDIIYLSTILENARYRKNDKPGNNSLKIQIITRQYIAGISAEIGINLNGDYDFFENLSNHLESVFSAPPVDYPEIDIVDEIIEENSNILKAVMNQMPVIYQYTERRLNDAELKYIAIHVCAALERKKNKEITLRVIVSCHAGIGTSRLLLEKLKRHFNFQIVDVISAHEVIKIDPNSADLVISTVPLDNCPVEFVVVSVSFSDADFVRVGSKIDAVRNSKNLPAAIEENGISAQGMIEVLKPLVYESFDDTNDANQFMKKMRCIVRDYFKQSIENEGEIVAPYLHHLLTPSFIELDVECKDWRDAIRKSADMLLQRGYIEQQYIDAMIHHLEESGPYVVLSEGFAIPHAKIEEGSLKLGMYLIRLKNPVEFGIKELDPVRYVCCLSVMDQKSYLKAFFNLVNLMKNNRFQEMLDQAKTPEEAASIIINYEYSIL
ncbi:MAG: PTS sugar transporter subunit IIA [Anaerobutyricum sp.]|nr:PTS sugar transporter subunit IIA [Anaerobutyricum sp.]